MNNAVEQILAISKAHLQASEGLTIHAHAGVEKLVELNLAASKAALEESFTNLRAALGAHDVQELMALQAGLTKPLAEKSAAYFQHVQAIATGASADLTKVLAANMAEAQKTFNDLIETLAKNVPAGAESAVAAFKNAMALGQNAVESAQTSAKKAAEGAQSNLTQLSNQAGDATRKVSKAT